MASYYIKNNSNDVDSDDYDRDTDDEKGHGSNENDTTSYSEDGDSCSEDDSFLARPRKQSELSEQSDGSTSSQMAALVLDESDNPVNASSASENGRTKGSNKDYDFVKTYESLVKARIGVAEREIGGKCWTRSVMYSTNCGDKICSTCRGYPKCPKRMQMLLDTESQDVHIYLSADEHDHSSINSKRTPQLDPLSRAKVLELIAVGVTQPRRLLKQLEILNLPAFRG